MKNNIIFLLIALFYASCHSHSEGDDHEGHSHAEEEHGSNEPLNLTSTTLSSEQMETIGIEFCDIQKKQLSNTIKANGVLKVPNQNKASANAFYGGIIKSILVEPGNKVNKGQIIATVSNSKLITMQEDFLNISSQLEYAGFDLERQKTLKDGNATALKTLQKSDSEYKILKAKKVSLQKQLDMVGINSEKLTSENMQSVINIISPISGWVSTILVNIGSYVEANNPIVEIVDNSRLHLDLFVYEKDLDKLKIGQTIHFTLTNKIGKEYDAKIFSISNTFESETKAIAVHAEVEGNKTNLIDGMSITAIISLGNDLFNAVPNEAIVSYQEQDFIFIMKDKMPNKNDPKQTNEAITFEKIPIMKGTSDLGYSQITLLKEIPANSKIVSKGAFFILAKMTNQGEAHSH